MTKKEKHQLINRDFLTFVEEEMDERYIIEDNGEGGRVHLILEDGEGHGYGDSIDYHLSRHTVDAYNDCSSQINDDIVTMEQKLDELIKQYEL
jgi:hypothetical protein|tara:strand:+ start:299 stop:577 length:279 start_codon:yes stop_codon:yes gene_type:complete